MIQELTELRERLLRKVEACNLLLNDIGMEMVVERAPAKPNGQGLTESRPAKREKPGRRGAPPSRKVEGENRLERAARGREIVLGLPMPARARDAQAALKEAGCEVGNIFQTLAKLVKDGLLRKCGRGLYERTEKAAGKPNPAKGIEVPRDAEAEAERKEFLKGVLQNRRLRAGEGEEEAA